MIERCAIIGAGISGLSAAYFLQKRIPGLPIDFYEAQDRIGGVIKSERISGCAVEGGPDSFLTMKKAASRLCEAIGLGPELVGSNDAFRKTFIVDEGTLKDLPDGFFMMVPTRWKPLVTTNLLTWPGKLEALADLFSFPNTEDCTVSDFIERRFGREVLTKIAEPMISGIYGADVDRLSVQSALPQIWEMQKKGSIILQLIGRRTDAGSGSLFTTLENGMESLIVQLKANIQADWKLGKAVDAVSKNGDRWQIGNQVYDAILFSTSNLPKIEMHAFDELASLMQSIRKNSAVVVVLAFPRLRRHGFGWLVPESERHSILACTYVSNKFPRRSPDDLFLVRAFIGGEQASKWIDRSDEEIRNEVLQELDRIAQIRSDPSFFRIFRWPNAMPEYQVGHQGKVERIQNLIRLNKGLHVTGNLFSGVGVPDCIQHAEKFAGQM